jgi:hypothetical protein
MGPRLTSIPARPKIRRRRLAHTSRDDVCATRERAVQVNIAIMRAFVKLRAMLASHRDLARRLAENRWSGGLVKGNLAHLSRRAALCANQPAPFDLLPADRFSSILERMEIHFTPETEKKLTALAAQSGRATADELVQDVIEEYFGDLAQARHMLDRRYDDLESGRVKPVPDDEVIARLRAKSEAYRASRDESV